MKILISLVTASALAFGSQSNNCVDDCDRVGFGVLGAIQGAIIGGPVGAVWALGMMKYAENYENPQGCNNEKMEAVKDIKITQKKFLDNTKTGQEYTNSKTVGVVKYDSFVNFAFDSYVINTTPKALKDINKSGIKSIQVNGHTDETGSDEYNYALGLKRAQSVKRLLVNHEFDGTKIKTTSYGESNPISKNYAKNRRVDLVINY